MNKAEGSGISATNYIIGGTDITDMGPPSTTGIKRRPFLTTSLALFSVLLFLAPYATPVLAQQQDYYPKATKDAWPMFGGGTERSSFSPWNGPIMGGLEWSVELGPSMISAPAIVDGVVYIGQEHRMVALELMTGHIKWTYKTDFWVSTHPLVYDGLVIFNGEWSSGNLIAIDKDSGKFVWSTKVGEMYTTSPLAVGDVIYTATNDKGIYALNARTGDIIWNDSSLSTGMHTSIAYHDGVIFGAGTPKNYSGNGSGQKSIFAMDATTQKMLWSVPLDGYDPASVVYSDGSIIIHSSTLDNGYVTVYNSTDGSVIWRNFFEEEDWNGIETTPAVGFGKIFVGAQIKSEANFRCYNLTTGSLIWSHRLDGGVISTPLVTANGVVYVHSYGTINSHSRLYAIDVYTGEYLWTLELFGSAKIPLALANGILLVAGNTQLLAMSEKRPFSYDPTTAFTIILLFFGIVVVIAIYTVVRILKIKKKKTPSDQTLGPLEAQVVFSGPEDLVVEPPPPQGELEVVPADEEAVNKQE